MKKIILLLITSALLVSCNAKSSDSKYQATQLSEYSFLLINTETGEGEVFYKKGREFSKVSDIQRPK